MVDKKIYGILIGGISLSLDADESEAKKIAANEIKRAGISPARINFSIYKRSVDARKKDDIRLVYSVAAKFDEPRNIKLPKSNKYPISELQSSELSFTFGSEKVSKPPVIVGMGPAGMFAALLLAENGYAPVIIDRGDNVANRVKCYENFVKFGVLDTESNIQFGAGGAGTFSDGKLLTRINDPRISYVLSRFCDFGAPNEIMYSAKPHIGTDLLINIVDRLLNRIEELGGKVIYRCCMKDIVENLNGTVTVKTTKGDIVASSVVLALGHSSRDTYYTLLEKGFSIDAKPFSVGVRIEHLRKDIDEALYGAYAGHEKLGKGEYHLSDTSTGRGVYTFCMCPGGVVVAGASEENTVVVNGMSCYARDGVNSNSAVAVSIKTEDYGGTPHKAIEFQRNLEKAAFEHGGGNYNAPVQTVGDFLDNKCGAEPSRIIPTYREGKYKCADLNKIFPEFVSSELKFGLKSFERKLTGFSCGDAVLTGVETRTSAPVRILRGDNMCAIGHDKIYPCGEGAGYAGGITSAAVDGIRVAIKIMERFQPIDVDLGESYQ